MAEQTDVQQANEDSEPSLWTLRVDETKAHANFLNTMRSPMSLATRLMTDEIYRTMEDPDGNFLEQFQTTGFDARFFEMFLFAYLYRSHLTIDRSYAAPDFMISDGNITVGLEATTVNPAQAGVVAEHGKRIEALNQSELEDYARNELAIRFGSALYSKLRKRYWELDHLRDVPLVLAIQAFHDPDSLTMSDSALGQYLYGLAQAGTWSKAAQLELANRSIDEHTLADKKIPSGFFAQPDAENISAVMWTNSGTTAKFARMGYQQGFGNETLRLKRFGLAFNPDPNAMDPTLFEYDLDHPPMVESWGQGLMVYHNPNCLRPIPREFFPDAAQMYVENGVIACDLPGWHPIVSKTLMLHVGEKAKELSGPLLTTATTAVLAITRDEFRALFGFIVDPDEIMAEQHGWFSDESRSFLGVLLHDKSDDDWNYVILARDQLFQFRAIDTKTCVASRTEARMLLQGQIAQLLSKPQRIFPQEPLER